MAAFFTPRSLRASTDEEELTLQNSIFEDARGRDVYVDGVYKEKASGARADRAELQRMIADLHAGEVVVAETGHVFIFREQVSWSVRLISI
nr:recombinase family protein [Pantoea stewartii]